jgi:tripartite-type tricarboxylate transporter receptor subunit TctC
MGLAALTYSDWFGLFVPKGTPIDIIGRAHAHNEVVMSLWSWKAGLAALAIVAATAYAVAQMPHHSEMHGQMGRGGPAPK